MLRLDQVDPILSGNKYWKLKYHFLRAKKEKKGLSGIGGPYSNLLYSLARGGQMFEIPTKGILRGPKSRSLTPALRECEKAGMDIRFVSREEYNQLSIQAEKENATFEEDFLLPIGANDSLGLKGTTEILSCVQSPHEAIICPIGTGNTFKGLANSKRSNVELYGFSVIRGMEKDLLDIETVLAEEKIPNTHVLRSGQIGKFGKLNPELEHFLLEFERLNDLHLDPVYTVKMLFAFRQLIRENPELRKGESMILHTGGLQGRQGFSFLN